jgi:hypothetical protein
MPTRSAERREKFQQDAFAAWVEYQATSLHVTVAEPDARMARIGTWASEHRRSQAAELGQAIARRLALPH